MPGEATKLGPFTGGMNTLSDPSAVSDSELVDCVNFELDLDGSLQSRPPVTIHDASPGNYVSLNLGYFIDTSTGIAYLICSGNGRTYYYIGSGLVVISTTFEAAAFVQYADKAWLVPKPGSTNPGGSWSPSGGFTPVAAIPQGEAAIIHKERMWIAPGKSATTLGSRVRFSNPADLTVWGASNFFDVNAGDGQNIYDLRSYQGSILIFKSDSMHQFSFESDPARGQITPISTTVGVSDIDCQVAYESTLFTYHEGNVYEMVNYNLTRINFKVPFTYENTAPGTFYKPVSLSIFGDRLVVRYYDRIYVFGLRTRTWTRWKSNIYFGKIVEVPSNDLNNTAPLHYAFGNLTTDPRLYKMRDTFDSIASESMECYVRTRNYDYQLSHGYKRLYWWGADIKSNGDLNATAIPITFGAQVTWDMLSAYTWDSISNNTWEQPLVPSLQVTTTIDTTTGASRKFVKLLQALRFRQIYFEASIDTDGRSTDGQPPVRLFNFITIIGTRQTVSKQIS